MSRRPRAGEQAPGRRPPALGCNAVGLSGVDGRLLVARRKTPSARSKTAASASSATTTPASSSRRTASLLRLLLRAGYTPVIAPLALGTEGERLNVDGDRAAALLGGDARRRLPWSS